MEKIKIPSDANDASSVPILGKDNACRITCKGAHEIFFPDWRAHYTVIRQHR